jgi:HAD superfamily hydrolase (TIGR01509 family)
LIQGIILDMDGTVTEPIIDFPAMRAEIGVPPDSTIIDYIEGLPKAQAEEKYEILLSIERDAAEASTLNGGVEVLLDELITRRVKTALVTNNHRWAMEYVVEKHGLRFDTMLSRDDGVLKPSPDLVERAMSALDLTTDQVVGLGDGRYDLESCAAAGVRFIYLTNGDRRLDHQPAVERLTEVIPLLEAMGPLP